MHACLQIRAVHRTAPQLWEGLLGPIREILKNNFHQLGDGLQIYLRESCLRWIDLLI